MNMSPEQFCYWLQGRAELVKDPPSAEEWKSIVEHLSLVFTKVTSPAPGTPTYIPAPRPTPTWIPSAPGLPPNYIPGTGDVPWPNPHRSDTIYCSTTPTGDSQPPSSLVY